MAASHNVGKIPTPGIPTPAVRKSSGATPPAQYKKADRAEAMFQSDMRAGKVKDLNAEREKVAKKTGAWPNGDTN